MRLNDGQREIERELVAEALAGWVDTPCPACDYAEDTEIEQDTPCPVCGAPVWGDRCPDPVHGCDYLPAPLATPDERLMSTTEPW